MQQADWQKIMDSTGVYPIDTHLFAMLNGYKCSRLSNSLKENILELKWNRPSDAQKLVYKLVKLVDDKDTISNKDKINALLDFYENYEE